DRAGGRGYPVGADPQGSQADLERPHQRPISCRNDTFDVIRIRWQPEFDVAGGVPQCALGGAAAGRGTRDRGGRAVGQGAQVLANAHCWAAGPGGRGHPELPKAGQRGPLSFQPTIWAPDLPYPGPDSCVPDLGSSGLGGLEPAVGMDTSRYRTTS